MKTCSYMIAMRAETKKQPANAVSGVQADEFEASNRPIIDSIEPHW